MTLLTEKGTFTKTVTTGASSQQVNLSNGSLTPKIIVLHTTGHTAFGTFIDDDRISYGFSNGTTSVCQAYRMDESAKSESYTFRDDSIICLIDLGTNAIVSQGTISAVAAGSFTINWTVQTNTQALNIHYEVVGGTDITNVSVVSAAIGNTSTGNHSFTGSGASWTPDFALCMSGTESASGYNALTTGTDSSLFCIGACDPVNEWVAWARDETVTTSDTDMYINPAACLATCSTASGAISFLANFVSFDNAAGGGITVNVTDGASNGTCRVAFLLVKGGLWECGTFQQRSGTGTQDVTFGEVHLDPSLVFTAGINSASDATVVANSYFAIGASDGTNEGSSWFGDQNGASTFVATCVDVNDKVYRQGAPAATASSSTTVAACDMSDMATVGKFTLNWTTADTTLRRMAYWTVGVSGAANFVRVPTTEVVTVSESVLGYVPGPAKVKFGTVTKDTTTGVHTQTFTNELGFRPKGMIIWGTGQTATGTAANAAFGLGMTTDNAANDWGFGMSDPDAVGTSVCTMQSKPNDCIVVTSADGTTTLVQASLNFQNNGFDIVYAAADAIQYKFNYFAFTAPNIASVYCSKYDIAGTGDRDITGPGAPGTIAFFGSQASSSNASSGGNSLFLGAAMSDTKQWAIASASDNATTSNTAKRQRTDRCVITIDTVSFGTVVSEATFVSWISNGLRLNFSAADTGDDLMVMVVRGGDWDMGAFDQLTSNGTQNITTTPSNLNTKGVLFASFGAASTTAQVDAHNFTLGGGDGTNECCSWLGSTDNLATHICRRDHSETKAIRMLEQVTGSANLLADADLSSITTAGQYTVNWTTTDATARQICWVACGDTISTGTSYQGTPSTENVTVSDASTTRIKSALRLPSTDSTTVSEASLTRTTQAFRTVSPDTTTVTAGTATQSITRVRVPTTDTVTPVDSSLTRMLSATRAPTPETVTPTDSSLTRMISASRTVSPDSTTVADSSITGVKTMTRIPATDSTTVADSSLTRLLSAARSPSTDSITVLDSSLTRILSMIRIPSQDTVGITEDVTGQYTQGEQVIERAPTPESVTVADASLTRLLALHRLPSTENITTGEILTRILSAIRSPALDSVVTADNATRAKTFVLAPASDSVTVADSSLTRMLSATRIPATETTTVSAGTVTRMLSLLRIPNSETVTLGESIGVTLSGRISRSLSDTVNIGENVTRRTQAFRVPTTDTINVNESLTRIRSVVRLTTTDSIVVSEAALTRIVSLARSVTSDTTNIIESSLTRVLQAMRSVQDTVTVAELQSIVSHARVLQDTIAITEPVLNRIVTHIRELGPEVVDVTESVFYQALHMFVFDSVTVAESLFSIRQALSGSVTYATPEEVRPLLGNIGPSQRTDAQINLAIDAAYDEINTKTNRIPPNEWKDTDHNFGIIKKLARYIAAKEMAVGIKDFDTTALQSEIDRLWEILTYDTTSSATQNFVFSSEPETWATSKTGVIWSTRYKNLRKGSGTDENDTTINPDT